MKKSLAFLFCLTLLFAVSMAFAATGKEMFETTCASCHGADGATLKGSAPLKGQGGTAILNKLKGYADGSYGGEKKQIMMNLVKKLSPEQMKAVADFAGTL